MKRLISWVFLLPFFVSAYAGNTVIPGRVSIKHFESDGVGFNGGYTSAQAMMAVPFNYQNIPFIDLRYHVFDRGRSALNAGLGYRFNADGVLLGLNAYYDARWTTGQTFSQFGGGLELLSRFLDFRANGYFPVKLAKQVVDAKFAGFSGHGLGIKVKERYALTGGNAELGAYIGRIGQIKMYLAGGGYYFKRQVCNTKLGATGRLRFSWLDNIWAQFSVQHDHLFQTNYQGTVSFNYPFWPKPRTNHWNYFPNFEALMIQPVERNEIIALCDVSSVVQATDKNGTPIFIWFVDNTSSSDGTFESPFPTLVQAQNASSPGQYIYVYPGDGTTTGMDAGITLQSKQFFYGAGVEQLFITSYGVVKVPAQAGANPNITNTAGTGITLASGNVVRGFNILSPTNIGITGSNVGTSLIDQTSITSAGSDAIRVTSTGSNTVNISVVDCTASSSGGNGINFLPSNTSTMTAVVQGSSVNSNTSNGLLMMATNTSSATITVNNSNTFNNNGADGVSISASNQTLAATVSSNTMTGNVGSGVDIGAGSGVLGTVTVASNTIKMPAIAGINFTSAGTARISASITGNTITNPLKSGVTLSASGTSGPTVTLSSNTITAVAGVATTEGGITITSSSTSPGITATLNNNTINGTNNSGIILSANGGVMNVTGQGNSITAPANYGIEITGTTSAGTITAAFSATAINMPALVPGVDGIYIDGAVAGGRTYNLTFSSNTITGPSTGTGSGINVYGYGGNIINLTLSNGNTISGYTGGAGITATSAGSNPTFNLTIENNTFSGNNIGIDIHPFSTSISTLTLNSNTISSGSVNDVVLDFGDNAVNQATMTGNTINNTAQITTQGAAQLCLDMSGNTATTYTLTNSGGTFTVVSANAPSITDMQNSNVGTFTPLTPANVTGVTACSP